MIQIIIDKTILSLLGMWEARWWSSYIGQLQRRNRRKNDPRCWKWKHAGVILDELNECTRCGGIFTPAWPSVPPAPFTSTRLTDKRAVLQEPWWKPLFIGTQFPHFPLSRFLALGNICLQKFSGNEFDHNLSDKAGVESGTPDTSNHFCHICNKLSSSVD